MSAEHQVVWPKCSVTNPATAEDVILKQGDMLPDWVSDFTRFVLVSTGGVRIVAEPDPVLLAALPEPVRLQEHPDPPFSPESPGESPDGKPKIVDPKERWVEYAVSQRPDDVSEADAREWAEGKTKAELVAQYK
jgi:hypothetical protein